MTTVFLILTSMRIIYLSTAAEVRQGWWAASSVLSSEEVEIADEPRLPDAGDSLLSPLELADECSERDVRRPTPGLDKKLVNLQSLPPLELLQPSVLFDSLYIGVTLIIM